MDLQHAEIDQAQIFGFSLATAGAVFAFWMMRKG